MNRCDQKIILKIVNLRKQGFSIPEISREIGISQSTVLRYVKNVTILPGYRKRWLDRRNASKIISERQWTIVNQRSESLIRSLNKKELLLVASMLYWGEGAKRDFSISNTDAKLIKVFIQVLRKVFYVHNKDMKISLRIYEDLNKNECLKYWSGVTGVKLGHDTSVSTLKGRKLGRLRYGMCRIRVRKGGLLLKQLLSVINKVHQLLY